MGNSAVFHWAVFVKGTGGPFTKSAYKKMYRRIFSLIDEAVGENDIVMYFFGYFPSLQATVGTTKK